MLSEIRKIIEAYAKICENCHKREKNYCCYCGNYVCDLNYTSRGCCSGTHMSGCLECVYSDLDMPENTGGFICEECEEYCHPCCYSPYINGVLRTLCNKCS